MKQTNSTATSRRGFVTGTATLGAAAAAATALPQVRSTAPVESGLKPKPARGGGYSLSEHVKRYYKTTLV